MQQFVQWRCIVQQVAGPLQCRHRVTLGLRPEAAGEQLLQCRVALAAADQRRYLGIQFIARPGMTAAEGEYQHAQCATDKAVGEVVEQPVQRLFRLAQAFFHGPAQQWLHVLG
ncbi:hypothetical protein D3C73_1365000 [compost metagenome]